MPNTLFSQSYLEAGLKETDEYQQVSPQQLSYFGQDLRVPYRAFVRAYQSSNEAQIEAALIRPVLEALGWSYLPQQTIPISGRTPDYMLFADDDDLADFTAGDGDVSVYPLAPAEAKAWDTDLDRRAGAFSPSGQIQDYLRQFWQATAGRVKWGILTNGDTWRLYRATGPGPDGKFHQTQDAWLELKLSECVSDAGKEQRRLLLLFFHRDAFQVGDDGYCFLDRALAQAADYVQNVVDTLTEAVFEQVYPRLIRAFYRESPDASPDDVQEASLTLLYRLLFLMYAEDRRLLPVGDANYDRVSLRALRRTMLEELTTNQPFTSRVPVYWLRLQELFDWIDQGESSVRLPAYNGGLFSRQSSELLTQVRLPDASLASIVNSLGAAVNGSGESVMVNFRDLNVAQLGALYESLLEHRPAVRDGVVEPQLQPYARKDTGSYYTPPELTRLIVEQTLGRLIQEREDRFHETSQALALDTRPADDRRRELESVDPATAALELKVLDPAMGSGHFLVAALDYLTREVDRLVGYAAETADWLPEDAPYVSPLAGQVERVRAGIQQQADEHGWQVNPDNLSDQAIIRRLALKSCIYGVDLNPMTVELAKMSLWLHSFTMGAPLSFLDHHLRCGDSLVGGWLAQTAEDIRAAGGGFADYVFARTAAAAEDARAIERISDADIGEVKESETLFRSMEESVAPARRMLNFFTGLRWMAAGANNRPLALRQPRQLRRQIGDDHATAVEWWLSQDYDTQVNLLQHGPDAVTDAHRQVDGFDFAGFARFITLWRVVEELIAERRMLHWELAFPGVFTDWHPRSGGFDAVIGNPPWERVKLQEVEWFAPETRRPEIARATPASRRRAMIAQLETDGDPLYPDYAHALNLADTMLQYGRVSGDYPKLGGGDTNLYRLFVERANGLADSKGIVALLTPSGIYADQSAAAFFGDVTGDSRLLALYDFENRRGPDAGQFFPDVDSRFKFCTLIVGGNQRTAEEVPAGFLLHDPPGDTEPKRLITLEPTDFALVNPNTGTAPIFLTKRDADITLDIYRNHPVFDAENKNFENAVVRHVALAHMTNDSRHFWTREQLVEYGAYPVGQNQWRKGDEWWLPLYQARMMYHFDHRYNSVKVNPQNVHNPYIDEAVTEQQHSNPGFYPDHQYYVRDSFVRLKFPEIPPYAIGFRDITNPTNERTMISSIMPWAGYGNNLPILVCNGEESTRDFTDMAPLWTANFCSFAFDFVARRKVQGTHMNLYILEQLPVITRTAYDWQIGDTTAADLVRDHALRLCYTAWDLEPFALSQGYEGEPYGWDVEERRHLRARLDALYFLFYGLDRDDAAYVMDSFPITRRNDEREHGNYLTKELILAYMNALAAGDTETVIAL